MRRVSEINHQSNHSCGVWSEEVRENSWEKEGRVKSQVGQRAEGRRNYRGMRQQVERGYIYGRWWVDGGKRNYLTRTRGWTDQHRWYSLWRGWISITIG